MAETPKSWYRKNLGKEFVVYVGAICFFVPIPFLYLNSRWSLDSALAWSIALPLWSGLMIVTIGSTIYRLNRYSNLINNIYYQLVGWNDFFEKRTNEFWKKRNYTNIKINFILLSTATDNHRETVKAFTATVIHKWNKRYEDKDMEWTNGAPKDLSTSGMSIQGDVSLWELLRIAKILVQFIPVAKQLGSNLTEVSIQSNSKERHHPVGKNKTDVYDRHMSWETRHTLDD